MCSQHFWNGQTPKSTEFTIHQSWPFPFLGLSILTSVHISNATSSIFLLWWGLHSPQERMRHTTGSYKDFPVRLSPRVCLSRSEVSPHGLWLLPKSLVQSFSVHVFKAKCVFFCFVFYLRFCIFSHSGLTDLTTSICKLQKMLG